MIFIIMIISPWREPAKLPRSDFQQPGEHSLAHSQILMLEHCYILTFSVKSCCYILTGYQSVKVVTISHLEKEVLNDPTLTATLLWVWRIHQLPDQVFFFKIELLNSLSENNHQSISLKISNCLISCLTICVFHRLKSLISN